MAAKIEADMSMICEKCRYIEEYDHVFMIDETALFVLYLPKG